MRRILTCLLFLAAAAGFAQAPVQAPAAPAPAPAKPRVRLVTSYGPIVLELEAAAAPRTVANFLAYVKAGHYAGTLFHRVIPGFMIQGGGMKDDLTEKPTEAPIPNEAARSGLRNLKGTVAMARTEDPDSATAQFFINTFDNASLDAKAGEPGYCVFGRVVEGMDVVSKIEQVRTVWRRGMQNVPDYPVRIKSAEVMAP